MSKKGKYMFSRHAFDRLKERTKITAEEIAVLFDNGIYLNLGAKPGLSKDHILFYSKVDNDFYVAIQDSINGDIVTILPLDYHSNLAWGVTEKDKEIVLKKHENYELKEKQVHESTVNFQLKIHYRVGNRFNTKDVCKKKALDYDNNVNKFINDRNLKYEIERVKVKHLIEIDEETLLSVRLGNNGSPTFFNLNEVIKN